MPAKTALKKTPIKSLKLVKAKKDVINIVGNNLWIFSSEKSEDTLQVNEINESLPIEWHSNKSTFIRSLLSNVNLLKNGSFCELNKKSSLGWEIEVSEPASGGVDLSEEWHLKKGHTAFLIAPEFSARPLFRTSHKIPVLETEGNAEYFFSGYFATHRAGGSAIIDFYDKQDNKIGEHVIDVPYDPKYVGGHSLASYAHIESTFKPMKDAQYMYLSIKIGKQLDFSEPHACLFFSELCLANYDKNKGQDFIPYSMGVERLIVNLMETELSNFGSVKLPKLEQVDSLTVEYLNKHYQVDAKTEFEVIELIQDKRESSQALSDYHKKYFRSRIEQACANKNWHGASEALVDLIKVAQNNIDLDLLYGNKESEQGNADAIKILDAPTVEYLQMFRYLTEIKPTEPFAWQWLGETAYQLKRWEESCQAFNKLSELQLLSNNYIVIYADALEHVYQYEDAFYLYLQAWNSGFNKEELLEKLLHIAQEYDMSELSLEAITLIIKIARATENTKFYSLIRSIFPIKFERLRLLDLSLEDLMWLLARTFVTDEKNKNWSISLGFLEILDKKKLLKELPDWLAVELLWLSVTFEKIINEPNQSDEDDNKLEIEQTLKKLRSLRFWKKVIEFDQHFALIDVPRLKHSHKWKTKPIAPIHTLSQFLMHSESWVTSPHILFNYTWYKKTQYFNGNNQHPLVHFFRSCNGYQTKPTKPNPYFDSDWYQKQYLKNNKNNNPLLHYMAHFQETGVKPNQWFDCEYVRVMQGLLPNEDPLVHYLKQLKDKEATSNLSLFSPTPYFDRKYYLEHNQDLEVYIKNGDFDLFEHFINHGVEEGRIAHPWQRYNQFVRHQMLHLEPVNLNSPINEHKICYLKREKAEAAYFSGQKVLAKQMTNRPFVSVLVPVYQVNPTFLQEMIESVLGQTYENWELCLVDDASIRYQEEIATLLKDYARKDKRIKYSIRKENGHICNTTNDCLAMAKGEYVALLDHDDLLTPDALYEMAVAINANPDLDIIYSDEDKVDEWGVFSDPYYKPDWSPHSLWARMYVCHLTVYRKSLVEKVGGFRVGYEGSQDYDLILRCSEKTNHIHHIPKVLYHWRSHSESTAGETGGAAKNYCADAGHRAIKDAMQRRGLEADTGLISEQRTAIWVKPKVIGSPLVDVIIPSRNGAEILSTCLQSIFKKTSYQNFKVTVVDNNSNDDDFFTLINYWKKQEPSRFQVVADTRDFNFSAINNLAVKQTKGEFILFLNNDTEVITEDWVEALLGYAQLNEVGAVGAKLLYPDDTIQHAGVVTGIGGVAGHAMKHFRSTDYGYCSNLEMVTNYSAVTAACLMISRKKFNKVDGFEEYLQVAFNDVDFCLKLRQQGLFNVYLPFVELYHYESKSRGYEDTPEKQERFENEVVFIRQRYGKSLDNDPFYSPWLTHDREDMSFRFH